MKVNEKMDFSEVNQVLKKFPFVSLVVPPEIQLKKKENVQKPARSRKSLDLKKIPQVSKSRKPKFRESFDAKWKKREDRWKTKKSEELENADKRKLIFP